MNADAKLAEIAFPEGQDHSLLPLFLLPHCPQPHVAHFFLVSLLTTFFVFLFWPHKHFLCFLVCLPSRTSEPTPYESLVTHPHIYMDLHFGPRLIRLLIASMRKKNVNLGNILGWTWTYIFIGSYQISRL